MENYPLVFYSAWHWIGDTSSSILDRMEQLFDPDKLYFFSTDLAVR